MVSHQETHPTTTRSFRPFRFCATTKDPSLAQSETQTCPKKFAQYRSNPSAYTFNVYREESNKFSKLMKRSRWKYEQLALKAKTQSKLFFAHVWRNRYLKKNITSLKDNEGETIFTAYAQTELLKDFYSSIFREDDERPAPPLPVSRVVMPVPQFSISVACGDFFNLDILRGAGSGDIHPQMVC